MAEIYLGLPPKAHLEQFWQKTFTLTQDGRTDILYAKWKSLASLNDKMRFLLGLHARGWLSEWWKSQNLDREKSQDLLEMTAFSCALLKLPVPAAKLPVLEKLKHPWARLTWSSTISPESFQKVLKEQQAEVGDRLTKKRQELLNQMDLSRNLGLRGEETKFLEILQNVFPQDHSLKQERESAEEKQVYETLQRMRQEQKGPSRAEPRIQLSAEEKKWLEFLRLQIEKKQGLSLERQILFSYIFFFMEDYESALILLNHAPPSLEVDFLRVEALGQLGRHLEVLALVDEMEAQCLSEKELLASLQLSRAKALYGLDRKEVAIEILRGLTFHEPGFRESEILLRMWEGELGL